MGMVEKFNTPTTAGEMARVIETFFVSEFGWSSGGGYSEAGGALTYGLENDDIAVIVLPSDQAAALRQAADRISMHGERLEWLDADELAIIEAHRAAERDDDPGEPHGSITDVGAVAAKSFFAFDGLDITASTWFGPADEWDDEHPNSGLASGWAVFRVDGMVQAVRLNFKGERTTARYAAEALIPSSN